VKSRLIVLIGIAMICMTLACSLSQPGLLKEARVSPTPTRTPRPTYTTTPTQMPTPTFSATPIPSPTPTASPTPLPTNTPLPSPLPTETLPPTPDVTSTQTPVPTPLGTATPTVRPTRSPTRRPTNTPVPQPTNTPPPPFTGNVVIGYANCSWNGVEGVVSHAGGGGYGDVAVGVWSDEWWGSVTTTEPSGKFSLPLRNVPLGTFWVAVVQWETCGQHGDSRSAVECNRLSNRVEITITEHCKGPGASNSAVIEFTGP
jgi:hypothetical protein